MCGAQNAYRQVDLADSLRVINNISSQALPKTNPALTESPDPFQPRLRLTRVQPNPTNP